MVSQTNEQALESAIEKHLTGTSLEELKNNVQYQTPEYISNENSQLYSTGLAADFDPKYAIDKRHFWDFLNKTQEEELAKLKRNSPNDWQRTILDRFDRLIKKYGILQLLKKGLSVDDAHFNLMYPAPLASSSDKVKQNYSANIFSVTRQVRYSLAKPSEEIDMVLFLNGIALVTLELKNAWTGQTARYHGQKQYCNDRDITQPLLNFSRCLVHMTLDTDEVFMTTKLAGKGTFFLPFNKGHNLGQGNPPNISPLGNGGHKTAYLWQEVFSKDSLTNIIQHFVRLDGSIKDQLNKRTLFFPRYHQLDVVRRLVKDVANNGVGQTYLVQHSAGSGKSNSITWAAYQLIETYPVNDSVPGSKGIEQPLFDSVIVVTDRRLLDKQLRANIKDFSEVKNIVAPANKSSELKSALENGKKIIITTIQKFPFIIDGICDLSDKRFAVIIDEAHSSQSGDAHDNMNKAMGKNEDVNGDDDIQDKILKAMQSRKMRGNASYFAFTATPKNATFEKFGQEQSDGSFKEFHLYSMKQAIEEGFILDVLANYTTYKSYYEIQKSIADNPQFDSKKAQKKLRAYVESSQQTINVKAEIMMDHFIPQVVNTKKLKGKAKAMVITQNIETAIRYHKAIKAILEQQGNPFKALIAFSGTKEVGGSEYTEADLNGFPEKDTAEMFDKNWVGKIKPKGVNEDTNRLLIVANKYLTGFDQPKLCSMYVDKKLEYVLAVQALSRLNRSAPKLGKKTEDLFVLDFFNKVEDIKSSFDPFYTATSLSAATDVNVLHELKDVLDDVAVYEWYEVEDFVKRYFDNVDAQALSPILDIAAARFNSELELEEEDKIDFKIKAKQFVKIYGQMASIMPFENINWEKLFWFLKFLIPKLKIEDPDKDILDKLLDSVDLSSYGLERVKLNHTIELDDSETEVDPQNPNPRGSHGNDSEKDPLDEIIKNFNERWFQGWSATPEEQKIKFVNIAESIKSHPDFEAKYQKNPDHHNRELAFEKIVKEIMLQRRKEELELYKLYAGDSAFKTSWTQSLQNIV
jgi:type I restriction enzyme R subunit